MCKNGFAMTAMAMAIRFFQSGTPSVLHFSFSSVFLLACVYVVLLVLLAGDASLRLSTPVVAGAVDVGATRASVASDVFIVGPPLR